MRRGSSPRPTIRADTHSKGRARSRKLLQCDFLPFHPDAILIHQVRADGGSCQVLEHVPTGIKKPLTRATDSGRVVLQKRNEALDELALELALGEE